MSFATRSLAELWNATTWPSVLSTGRTEARLPPSVPALLLLANVVVPFTETIEEVDDMLTLKGLRLIHERNA